MDGLLALTLWDVVIDVLDLPATRAMGDPPRQWKSQTSQTSRETIDHVPPNAQDSSHRALISYFEDTEAVIKMIIKGRIPHMRHVLRTHRVHLDRLFDRISKIPQPPQLRIGVRVPFRFFPFFQFLFTFVRFFFFHFIPRPPPS